MLRFLALKIPNINAIIALYFYSMSQRVNANTFIPEHFIDDVKTYLPAHLNLDDFLNACRRPLRKSIRVNTLKISIEEFVKRANE